MPEKDSSANFKAISRLGLDKVAQMSLKGVIDQNYYIKLRAIKEKSPFYVRMEGPTEPVKIPRSPRGVGSIGSDRTRQSNNRLEEKLKVLNSLSPRKDSRASPRRVLKVTEKRGSSMVGSEVNSRGGMMSQMSAIKSQSPSNKFSYHAPNAYNEEENRVSFLEGMKQIQEVVNPSKEFINSMATAET